MKQVLIFIIAAICLAACKKDSAATLSNTQLITKQLWKLTALTQTLSTGVVQDMFAPMSACYKDDQYVYKANLGYESNAGTTKCDPSDPQVFASGTWKFINSETELERTTTAGLGVGVVIFKILVLTETQLKLTSEDGGIQYTLTFSH